MHLVGSGLGPREVSLFSIVPHLNKVALLDVHVNMAVMPLKIVHILNVHIFLSVCSALLYFMCLLLNH